MQDVLTQPLDIAESPPQKLRPGLALSLLLHVLALLLIAHRIGETVIAPLSIPVDLVTLSETETRPDAASAGAKREAALQQQQPKPPSRREAVNPNPPSRVAPSRVQEPLNDRAPTPPKDALQTQLDALSKLASVETDPRLLNGLEASGRNRRGAGTGAGTYSVKDFIRAQVIRRWNLDLGALGGKPMVVSIHLVLERDGSVAKAEIVGTEAYGRDAVYRSVAISARNAVLLSSPFTLPKGSYEIARDMVLDLNPKDTVR